MGVSDTSGEVRALDDIHFFDLKARRWVAETHGARTGSRPAPRHSHLTSLSGKWLFIIGGQGSDDAPREDVHVYDLEPRRWVSQQTHRFRCGTNNSVAVVPEAHVELAEEPTLAAAVPELQGIEFTPPESLIHLPYSVEPTEDHPCDIIVFDTHNVRRRVYVSSQP